MTQSLAGPSIEKFRPVVGKTNLDFVHDSPEGENYFFWIYDEARDFPDYIHTLEN